MHRPPPDTLDAYLDAVSRLMNERYALTWADACGEVEPVEKAWRAGEEAAAFVAWWGAKYDLTPTR